MNVSYFKSAVSKYPYATVSLFDMFDMIKDGTFKNEVESYRSNKTRENKIKISAYSASGTFSKREVAGCESYNGIVCMDIDKKDNLDIDFILLRERLKKAKSVLAIHWSVGGEGLAVYIKTDNNKIENHEIYFKKLCDDFNKYLNVNCDTNCSDISRLRFVSFDNDIYINSECSCFIFKAEERDSYAKETGINARRCDRLNSGEIRDSFKDESEGLISFIKNIASSGEDITSDYHDWSRIAFILSDVYGESGRDLFHLLSQNYYKYSYIETNRIYDSAMRRNGTGSIASINTFYYICLKYGVKRRT